MVIANKFSKIFFLKRQIVTVEKNKIKSKTSPSFLISVSVVKKIKDIR